MKTPTEIRNWILENCVDEYGTVDITNLDFSKFNGDIRISGMKVKRNLDQSYQDVQGDLRQSYQEVQGSLYQSGQEVQGNYYSNYIKVGGKIYANEPTQLLEEVTTKELEKLGYKIKGASE